MNCHKKNVLFFSQGQKTITESNKIGPPPPRNQMVRPLDNPIFPHKASFLRGRRRGLAESVLKLSIGVGTFKKDFFCLTQV